MPDTRLIGEPPIGTKLRLRGGGEVKLTGRSGQGRQAWVFEGDMGGKRCAVKWFRPSFLAGCPKGGRLLYRLILEDTKRETPFPSFMWPRRVSEPVNGSFGYVMRLVPRTYRPFADYISKEVSFSSFRVAARAGSECSQAFRVLHNEGYAFQDINDSNALVKPNPSSPNVQVVAFVDCDNIVMPKDVTGVVGSGSYMAPEVIGGWDRYNRTGDEGDLRMPDRLSDRHSLAVLLYQLLTLEHPLEGMHAITPAMDTEMQLKLYGTHPIFVFDEHDPSNRPDPTVHRNSLRLWPQLPSYVRATFLEAFSAEALHDPGRRPHELRWVQAFEQLQSDIVTCLNCGNEVFLDNAGGRRCDRCGHVVQPHLRLGTDGPHAIPVHRDALVYRGQCGPCNPREAILPVATFEGRGDGLVMRNVGRTAWRLDGGGEVAPGAAARAAEGLGLTIDGRHFSMTRNDGETGRRP